MIEASPITADIILPTITKGDIEATSDLTMRFNCKIMERKFMYKTKGTCSSEILITLDGDIIKSISFFGGCSGNTQGVSILAAGQHADNIISSLKGVRCGFKQTSCPDQLARALIMIKELPEDVGSDGNIVQLNF